MKKSTTQRQNLKSFADGRDENNLAEFPIALLGDSVPAGQKTVEFEDTMEDWSTGRTIIRRVCITGSDKFGLPTAKDEEVLMGLIQLTRIANDFTSPEVWFVKRDVLEILGWEDRGWAYARVEESLHRWKGVSIHYWNAWRDHENGSWRDSAATGVIEYLSLTDGRYRNGGVPSDQRGRSCFCWNKLFFQSFQSGYLKKLDFSVYRSLKGAASKRAYRFLDKRFFYRSHWQFDLRQFACEKLGFSRAYTTGQLKERVRPVLGELEQVGFIEPHSMKKERPKVWSVSVTRKAESTTSEKNQLPVSETSTLTGELEKRGVTRLVAARLCERHSAEQIAAKLKFVDWLVARNDARISKSVAGFLVACISNDFPLPADYLATLEARRPPTGRQSQKSKSSAGVAMGSEQPTIDTEPDEIDDYIDRLSPTERTQLVNQAMTSASDLERSSLLRIRQRGSSLYLALERNLLRKHLHLHNWRATANIAS